MRTEVGETEPSRKRRKLTSNNAVNKNTARSSLPDLVIHRVLTLLPTNAAFRLSHLSKQWEGLWSLTSVLHLNEDVDDDDDYEQLLNQHEKFIQVLHKYLEYRKEDKTSFVLDTFTLQMTRFFFKDSGIVDEWLNFANERSVKEVNLSLATTPWNKKNKNYNYCISPTSFLIAKFMTSLNLEFVTVSMPYMFGRDEELKSHELLPSLKKLTLKNVYFKFEASQGLLTECPSIECLSLTSCKFEDRHFKISSPSLRSFEATDSAARRFTVYKAVNLESFTFSSAFHVTGVALHQCHNLKHANIHAPSLERLKLSGCYSSSLNANVFTPSLDGFQFSGLAHCKLSLTFQPSLQSFIQIMDKFDGKEPHDDFYLALTNFLKEFDGSHYVILRISDFRALMFPEKLRETLSAPLSMIENLRLDLYTRLLKTAEESELKQSLNWLAPSASIEPSSTWPQSGPYYNLAESSSDEEDFESS